MRLVDVALPVPVPRAFTYRVPGSLGEPPRPGTRVVCPFGARRLVGVVLEAREGEPPPRVKTLVQVLEGASIPEELLGFLRDLSSYYLAPIGEVVKLALPPLDRETALAEEAGPSLFATTRGISARRIRWLVPTEVLAVEAEARLPAQTRAVLAVLRASGGTSLVRLQERFSTARSAAKKLESLGLARTEEREASRDPFFESPVERDRPKDATAAQEEAILALKRALYSDAPAAFLLHGVTGSGKTEVYMRAIADAKARGLGVVVLVPEIALTPQLVARFRARFGDDVAVLHSGLTLRERLHMWQQLRSGQVDVAIGARSALFAPIQKLGLLVVDEEHDPSFKQEEGVRYHARDMALYRAHKAGAVCVLGSATPSLESERLVRTGKIERLVLPDRARSQAMPEVQIVDLRHVGAGPTGDKRLSLPLHRAIEDTLERGGQIILFLNRRGHSPAVRCEACGAIASCPNCSVALTFHRGARQGLRCHTCEHEEPMRARCSSCSSRALVLEGLGTEKLEATLEVAFPKARIARLDRDSASGKNAEKILTRVRAREVDILVGTQMVTKGHDLPAVTLVGVINADSALSIPDFRAGERAFQLLVQVAGRAGRGDEKGLVIVQTYDPEHAAIRFGVHHDVKGFVVAELEDRRELGYPPFSRMALVRVDAVLEEEASDAARQLAELARMTATPALVEILGPAPAPVARIRGRYRYRVMLRSSSRGELRKVLLAVARATSGLPRTVRVVVDIDPVQML